MWSDGLATESLREEGGTGLRVDSFDPNALPGCRVVCYPLLPARRFARSDEAAPADWVLWRSPRRVGAGRAAEPNGMITPTHELMVRVRQAFLDHGYDALTMVELAQACAFTRRALYHYFNSKEAAYRAVIRHFNAVAVANGLEAGAAIRRRGGGALDVLAETLDVRYGDTRRDLNTTIHTVELNAEAFRRGRDIMIESAIAFHAELERLIRELMADGLMTLKPNLSPASLAQLLTDGARGVNQSLPPIATDDYAERYRQMVEAILYGSATALKAREGRDAGRRRMSEPAETEPVPRRVRD